jgi:two-component system, LytTR family, response regulator
MGWAIQAGKPGQISQILLVGGAVIMTLSMMLQDLLASKRGGYAFYWNESFLFSSYWLFAVPVWRGVVVWVKQHPRKFTATDLAGVTLLAIVAHMILYAFAVWFFSWLFMDHSYGFRKNLYYTVSTDLVKYMLIYGSLMVYLRSRTPSANYTTSNLQPDRPSSPHPLPQVQISVTEGKTTTLIPVSSVLYIHAADPYIAIYSSGKKHLISQTLSGISAQLDLRFLRIHRSTIVNVREVRKWTSRGNGDYDVVMSDDTILRLSRNYARMFREVMETFHST